MGEGNQAIPQQLRLSVSSLSSFSLSILLPRSRHSNPSFSLLQTAAVSLARIHTLLSTRKPSPPLSYCKQANSPFPLSFSCLLDRPHRRPSPSLPPYSQESILPIPLRMVSIRFRNDRRLLPRTKHLPNPHCTHFGSSIPPHPLVLLHATTNETYELGTVNTGRS